MPRHTPPTHEERIDNWVAVASKGHDGFYQTFGSGKHRKTVCVTEPDKRTPHERLDGMIAAGKKVGVDLDPEFIAEVKARLPKEA